MTGLRDILPDREIVLHMRPEELAPILLRIVPSHIQNGMFLTETVGQVQSGRGYNHFGYVDGSDREVERATSEAWAWLERQGLIMPAPGINGSHGWKVLSREAETIKSDVDFARFHDMTGFPKSMLYPSIAERSMRRYPVASWTTPSLPHSRPLRKLSETLASLVLRILASRSCEKRLTRTRGL
jgi:hypothetical protein